MKKYLLFLGAFMLCATANAQFFQGFDNAATNNWSFTASPAKYNFPTLEDVWSDTTIVGNTSGGNIPISATQGTRFWGMWDLQNPHIQNTLSLPAPYYHYIDFDAVNVAGMINKAIKFKYFTHIVGGTGDSVGYIVEYNNGTVWNQSNYVHLNAQPMQWDSVMVAIPAGTQYVRLRFVARINGGDDYAGIDEVQVTNGAPIPPTVAINKEFIVTHEAADTLKVGVSITNRNANNTTVDINAINNFGTAQTGDYVILTPSITWTSSDPDTQYVHIKIINDGIKEVTEYFSLMLENAANATIASSDKATVYIKDNDYTAPIARKNIELVHKGSHAVTLNNATTEIVAYDSISNNLYVANSGLSIIHVLDFSNPAMLTEVDTFDMSGYGNINSISVYKGVIAVAVENTVSTNNGSIVFLDTAGNFLNQVNAGAMPDMVTFTQDGKYVISANEGEPNNDYTIDPEGSVTVIDIQNGVANASAIQINFNAYNGQETSLRAQGIRIYGANNPTASQDFEPEYIAVNMTSDTAWVTLQENNAVATIHIPTKTIISLKSLGAVNHSLSGNAIDAGDNNGEVLIANWPVRGLYLPDAVTSYNIDGKTYLITANEGDAREYNPLEEEVRIGSNNYKLDSMTFPQAELLKKSYNLGRLTAINTLGDTDNDGDFDEIYVLGGRSFSIWDANVNQVFNSGDQLEQITFADPKVGKIFNASNDNNNLKNRSDNKGPEPEGVATGKINDTTYAFIALERIGGVMVYDITTPSNPTFVQYINTRDTNVYGGDNGAEGIIFIPAAYNPHKKNYVITANEVSATIAVFEINAANLSVNQLAASLKQLNVYPNPIENNKLFFSQTYLGK